MKEYVTDTMGWVKYLTDDLPPGAQAAFLEAERDEARIIIPEIALGEFLYLASRNRMEGDAEGQVRECLFLLRAAQGFRVEGLRMEDWDRFLTLPVPELHDRMIFAMAVGRGVPLISNDPEAKGVQGLRVIWR